MSAFVKIPLQALVLLTGVLVFVFYLFNQPPMLFQPVRGREDPEERARRRAPARSSRSSRRPSRRAARRRRRCAAGDAETRRRGADGLPGGRRASSSAIRGAGGGAGAGARRRAATRTSPATRRRRTSTTSSRRSSRRRLPIGLVGLIIAAIFAAAMSSIAAELNSLATATVIDIYRRLLKPEATRRALPARLAARDRLLGPRSPASSRRSPPASGSLIEVVNRFGSFFYGSLLGVFVLALVFRRANGHGAFVGLLAGIATVAAVALHPSDERHLVPLAQSARRRRRA